MILVDTNVLIYSINETAPQHKRSRLWLEQALSGGASIGFAWLALIGFLRLSTRPGALQRPISPADALGVIDDWLSAPGAQVLHPTPAHAMVLAELVRAAGTGGNLVNDAHHAALAIEHRAEIVTYDTDFARFPGVRWSTPPALAT